MPDDKPKSAPDTIPTMCKVECECGWTDVFSSGYSGIIIDCPECGKRHRIPTFHSRPEVDEQIDAEVMKRLLGDHMPEMPAKPSVNFKPLVLLATAIAVVVAVLAMLLIRPILPNAVAVAGGAISWPIAMLVAWWGQRRYLKAGAATSSSAPDQGLSPH
jgi:hypothetical protein